MYDQTTDDIIEELSQPQEAVIGSRSSITLDMAGQGSGKSRNIGYDSGMMITEFSEARGFIAANTDTQLTQSTLLAVFKTWKEVYGFTQYDSKNNPMGTFVVDKKPPAHFRRTSYMRHYHNTISFWNGALVFIGSLENYTAHDGKEFTWAHLDETKDTKEQALTDVIMGRLRQYGLWYDEQGNLHWEADQDKADECQAKGWTAYNPLKIHTSPAMGMVTWINRMFELNQFQKEIKRKCQAKGADFFYRKFDNKTVVIYSAYHNAPNLPPNFLENQEKNLKTKDKILKLVHGYPFSQDGGEYYPAFDRDKHVGAFPFMPGVLVMTTWDFNVQPHMTCICSQIEYLIRFIDEVGNKYDLPQAGTKAIEVMRIRFYREYCFYIPKNSVSSICIAFSEEHDPGDTEVDYYGDGMGLNRIEGLGATTRFSWVVEGLAPYLHNSSKKVKNPNVPPLTRRDLLNDIFAGKYPEIEVVFDDSLTETIEDFENVKQGPKGKVKTKVFDEVTKSSYEVVGHETDAVEYEISELFKHLIKKN